MRAAILFLAMGASVGTGGCGPSKEGSLSIRARPDVGPESGERNALKTRSCALGGGGLEAGCDAGSAVQGTSRPPEGVKASGPGPRVARRLSARELGVSLRSLLGLGASEGLDFPEDPRQTGYDNAYEGLVVDSSWLARYGETLAAALASSGLKPRSPLLGGCGSFDAWKDSCRDSLIDGFVARAWGRAPSPDERARLLNLFESSRSGLDAQTAAGLVAESILSSPHFLYRTEFGSRGEGGAWRLAPHEIARLVSYSTMGGPPDPALLADAASGALAKEDVRRTHVRRLLDDAKGRDLVDAFFGMWLGYGKLSTAVKDADLFPSFDAALAAEMRDEVQTLVTTVLYGPGGTLRALFTSPAAKVGPKLAKVYGLAKPGEVTLSDRPGVLLRAAFLASHSAPEHSNPIDRGLFVASSLLCREVPPPPANVLDQISQNPLDVTSTARTTRAVFEEHSRNPACAGCHRNIDGFGFPFEGFDPVGARRLKQAGVDVDTTSEFPGPGGGSQKVSSAAELISRVVTFDEFYDCSGRQIFRFVKGRMEGSGDTEAVDEAARLLKGETTGPLDVLANLIANDPLVRQE